MCMLGLILTLSLPHTAQAYHDNPLSLKHKFFKKASFLLTYKDELGLSEEQIATIKDLKYRIKRRKVETDSAIDIAMLDIYHEYHQEPPNLERMNTLWNEGIEAKRSFGGDLLQGLVTLKNILTPEQREKAKTLYEKEKEGGHCPYQRQ